MKVWQRFFEGILDFVYPPMPLCIVCDQQVRQHAHSRADQLFEGNPVLCNMCEQQFVFISDIICRICGRPWSSQERCIDCIRRKEQPFLYSRSAVRYNDQMKQNIAQYKYRGDRKLGEVMAYLLWRAWRIHYDAMKVDMITYIPLHEERLYERTFNQAEEMARLLGERVGVPVHGLLQRKKSTGKQSKKDRTMRLQAMRNVFVFANEDAISLPECPVIILVDDVYTTGTTIAEASCAIKKAMADAQLYGLTVAR